MEKIKGFVVKTGLDSHSTGSCWERDGRRGFFVVLGQRL